MATLRARINVQTKCLGDFLFGGDAAVTTHSADDLHKLMDRFISACRDFGLTISQKKTCWPALILNLIGNTYDFLYTCKRFVRMNVCDIWILPASAKCSLKVCQNYILKIALLFSRPNTYTYTSIDSDHGTYGGLSAGVGILLVLAGVVAVALIKRRNRYTYIPGKTVLYCVAKEALSSSSYYSVNDLNRESGTPWGQVIKV